MNRSILFLVLAAASITAQAQTQTSTIVVPAKPVFQVNLSTENYTYVKDQRELGNKAVVTSLNAAGLVYNKSENLALEIRPYIEVVTNKDNLASPQSKLLHENGAAELATVLLRAKRKTDLKIGTSNNIIFDNRYYAPVDHASRVNRSAGILRLDTGADWDVSPKWNVGLALSPRISLNTENNINKERGADAVYRLISAPFASYIISDKVSTYYAVTFDQRSVDIQRGNPTLIGNALTHEIGANWTVGPVTINPALTSDVNLADSSASVLTNESRFYAEETNSYNLNVYATF